MFMIQDVSWYLHNFTVFGHNVFLFAMHHTENHMVTYCDEIKINTESAHTGAQ